MHNLNKTNGINRANRINKIDKSVNNQLLANKKVENKEAENKEVENKDGLNKEEKNKGTLLPIYNQFVDNCNQFVDNYNQFVDNFNQRADEVMDAFVDNCKQLYKEIKQKTGIGIPKLSLIGDTYSLECSLPFWSFVIGVNIGWQINFILSEEQSKMPKEDLEKFLKSLNEEGFENNYFKILEFNPQNIEINFIVVNSILLTRGVIKVSYQKVDFKEAIALIYGLQDGQQSLKSSQNEVVEKGSGRQTFGAPSKIIFVRDLMSFLRKGEFMHKYEFDRNILGNFLRLSAQKASGLLSVGRPHMKQFFCGNGENVHEIIRYSKFYHNNKSIGFLIGATIFYHQSLGINYDYKIQVAQADNFKDAKNKAKEIESLNKKRQEAYRKFYFLVGFGMASNMPFRIKTFHSKWPLKRIPQEKIYRATNIANALMSFAMVYKGCCAIKENGKDRLKKNGKDRLNEKIRNYDINFRL